MSTVPIDRISSVRNVRAWVSMDFTFLDKFSAPRTIEKMEILGAVLELQSDNIVDMPYVCNMYLLDK